ncbi:MAG: hypothetical protein CMJ48_10875 [Planctomycetaceae bacterium]|nr:hypothetical protein [Planctomycetaceae bacterium]
MEVILELLLEAACVVLRIGRSEAKRDPHGCLVWFVGVARVGMPRIEGQIVRPNPHRVFHPLCLRAFVTP